jgi:ribosomal protein S8
VRYSKVCYLILNILTKNGYIYGYEIKLDGILVFLRYVNGVPIIREIAPISKPGRIITVKNKDMLGKFNNSFLIISTKNGLVGRGFNESDINRRGFGGILLFYII